MACSKLNTLATAAVLIRDIGFGEANSSKRSSLPIQQQQQQQARQADQQRQQDSSPTSSKRSKSDGDVHEKFDESPASPDEQQQQQQQQQQERRQQQQQQRAQQQLATPEDLHKPNRPTSVIIRQKVHCRFSHKGCPVYLIHKSLNETFHHAFCAFRDVPCVGCRNIMRYVDLQKHGVKCYNLIRPIATTSLYDPTKYWNIDAAASPLIDTFELPIDPTSRVISIPKLLQIRHGPLLCWLTQTLVVREHGVTLHCFTLKIEAPIVVQQQLSLTMTYKKGQTSYTTTTLSGGEITLYVPAPSYSFAYATLHINVISPHFHKMYYPHGPQIPNVVT